DLLTVTYDSVKSIYRPTWLKGNGDGTFQPPAFLDQTPFLSTGGGFSIAAADLNGDKRLDLVIVDAYAGRAWVMLNNGNGSFAPAVGYPTPYPASSVVDLVDLNHDGFLDLVVESQSGFAVLLNNGDGTFGASQS